MTTEPSTCKGCARVLGSFVVPHDETACVRWRNASWPSPVLKGPPDELPPKDRTPRHAWEETWESAAQGVGL